MAKVAVRAVIIMYVIELLLCRINGVRCILYIMS